MRYIVLCAALAALTGCGGGSGPRETRTVFATGPIYSACMASDRKARSRQLCGCIQAAANRGLSRGDQRRAVRFYRDPQRAQDVRQSDRPSDESFWRRYTSYAETAERMCR